MTGTQKGFSLVDRLCIAAQTALQTVHPPAVVGEASHAQARPWAALPDGELGAAEKKHSAALMRVNHVGEICAQALYSAQGLMAREGTPQGALEQAALEEQAHLMWAAQRLDELGSRPSLLNPLWYAGAFGLGVLAGAMGDMVNLGFVVETERQVEAHLASHLMQDARGLPAQDYRSRAIVAQMQADEVRHGQMARDLGGMEMPPVIRTLMRRAAMVMTTVAYYI